MDWLHYLNIRTLRYLVTESMSGFVGAFLHFSLLEVWMFRSVQLYKLINILKLSAFDI